MISKIFSRRRLGFHGHFSRFFHGDLSTFTDRNLKIFTHRKKNFTGKKNNTAFDTFASFCSYLTLKETCAILYIVISICLRLSKVNHLGGFSPCPSSFVFHTESTYRPLAPRIILSLFPCTLAFSLLYRLLFLLSY